MSWAWWSSFVVLAQRFLFEDICLVRYLPFLAPDLPATQKRQLSYFPRWHFVVLKSTHRLPYCGVRDTIYEEFSRPAKYHTLSYVLDIH